jgi:hypothetical protein
VDRYNHRFFCTKRLIKDIRVNLMLKWIVQNFSGMPVIFMMRHPLAVALSRLDKGWDDHFSDLLSQECLVEDFLSPFLEEMQLAQSALQRQVYLWSIENHVALTQLRRSDAVVVFYEDLMLNPIKQMERLSSTLRTSIDERVVNVLGRPSTETTHSASTLALGSGFLSGWQSRVSSVEMASALKILRSFGLDRVYGTEPVPLLSSDSLLQ